MTDALVNNPLMTDALMTDVLMTDVLMADALMIDVICELLFNYDESGIMVFCVFTVNPEANFVKLTRAFLNC